MNTLSAAPSPAAASALPATLRLGAVRLRVRDAARSAAFYTGTVGLALLGKGEDGSLRLGVGDETLIELVGAPDAHARPAGTTGLFHVALLVPDRPALAVVLRRLVAQGVRLGASDHLVSEALYLDDPDGNGIEIYRDRPEGDWRWDKATIEMATHPLDLRKLLADVPEGAPLDAPMPEGTRVGHVHLQVGDLARARAFYVDRLGFAITTERYPGALFVSAGGYHHHLGLNIWHSRNGGPAPANSVGLVAYEIVLPDAAAVEAVRARLNAGGEAVAARPHGFAVTDPWGTRAVIRAAN
ncbi:VOC family protein [Ancylobacter polymorphus]|uniref:VOC family protein n=1 Tax=Ancylobacter polymorphus TaxID=223390 RepID=A0A9E7CY20_9HYPH|nr:VOC family protein [Ancylobacter polymorphus]UOK73044.1 VOC family protein [Ancylobacter polymorphus]